jgi:hypothetical protein
VEGDAGDQLGIGIEAAGDTNRDGVPDVIASAPGSGRAFIYSGKDGSTLRTLKSPTMGEAFGRHVAGIGDVNGDGCADVIVGAPANPGAQGPGHAYVFSGRDGALLQSLAGERDGDGFGSTVAGRSDGKEVLLVVGAPAAGLHAVETGRIIGRNCHRDRLSHGYPPDEARGQVDSLIRIGACWMEQTMLGLVVGARVNEDHCRAAVDITARPGGEPVDVPAHLVCSNGFAGYPKPTYTEAFAMGLPSSPTATPPSSHDPDELDDGLDGPTGDGAASSQAALIIVQARHVNTPAIRIER